MIVSVPLDDVDELLHHHVHLLVGLRLLLGGVGSPRLDLRELPRDELVPSLQREVNGLRVEPTELVDDRPGEGVVEREVAR